MDLPMSFFLFHFVSSLFVWSSSSSWIVSSSSSLSFDGCSLDDYYTSLLLLSNNNSSSWSRPDLQLLITSTHRHVLDYTNSNTKVDVWRALMDLDSNTTNNNNNNNNNNTVLLIYKNIPVPAEPFGTPDTWNREHLWPSSRGVHSTGADFTDIHHLRPSDWNVNSARSNLYFGDCLSNTNSNQNCKQPATSEAALDTSSDGTAFGPPVARRGDIARALFYMDLRYSDGNTGESNLVLSDCPDERDNTMGYLSQLLIWHEQDPPDDRERLRNDRACEYWQGNRNIFVDYPELVQQLFGSPKTMVLSKGGWEYDCSVETNDNTTSSSSSSCESLRPGDVMVTAVHSDNPDLVALVALADLPAGITLFVTDNAWTGSAFRSNEGSIMLTVPSSGIPRGTVFGFGPGVQYGSQWQRPAGSFALSASGETLLVYCSLEDDTTQPFYHFLTAFSYSGDDWMASGLSPASLYGTGASALPKDLTEVATTLPHFDNYVYVGPMSGTRSVLQTALRDGKNWLGSNSESQSVQTTKFFIGSAATSYGTLFAVTVSLVAIPAMHCMLALLLL